MKGILSVWTASEGDQKDGRRWNRGMVIQAFLESWIDGMIDKI